MRAVFVSNYINHHQIHFCNEMYRLLKGGFTFDQTQAMEAEPVIWVSREEKGLEVS